MPRANCWDVKKCGREPGGARAKDLGICPACTDLRLHGIHQGKNGGRACWVLAGTLCGGAVQGTFASKLANCMQCEFYLQVKHEEGSGFIQSGAILEKLR